MQQHKSTKLKKQAMPKGRKEADERKFEGKILKKEARERCSSFCNMFGNWNDTRSEKSREDPRAQ
uniref:Uncharacterized protein n=1 Tax=Oryza meridionalis TaxID=40149 RepID=A0A0E0EF24_9ORYZ